MKKVLVLFAALVLAACQATGPGELATAPKAKKFPQRQELVASAYEVNADSQILVVYVGADNCPPCLIYKDRDYPKWVASPEYQHVLYREIQVPRFQNTQGDRYWPDELKWIRDQAYAVQGAPRWLVVVDGKIVANHRDWTAKGYPLLQQIVARKTGV